MDATTKHVKTSESEKLKAEVRRLRRLLREAEAEIARLEPLVDLDPLVPLFNRRAFVRELGRVASYCKRYRATAVLLYLDLDDFKAINDRFGHAAGDAVLKHVAHVLAQSTRKSDLVGRLGGDEFGVLLVRTDCAHGRGVAERLKATIAAEPVRAAGCTIEISASVGMALVDGSDNDEQVIQLADQSMYKARQAMMSGSN